MSNEQKKTIKTPLIIHPFFIGIFPVIFLFSRNIEQVTVSEIPIPILIILTFTFLAVFLLSFIFKDKKKAGIIVSFFLILFFSYGNVYNFIYYSGVKLQDSKYLLILWIIIFCLISCFIIKTKKNLSHPTSVLNIIAITLVLISLINILFYFLKAEAFNLGSNERSSQNNNIYNPPSNNQTNQTNPSNRPDIYYIILDGYARSDIQKEIFSNDNSELINYLKQKKFYIADKSRSNYCNTVLSLTSSLNFTYIEDIINKKDNKFNNYRLVKNMLKNNKVCDFLKNYGYKTVAFYSGFSPTVINTEISICPMPISEFQWAIITTTPLRDTGYKNLLSLESLHRYRILYTFEHMSDTTKITSPHFVFVHIVSPHPPFIFREKGEKVDKPAMLFFDGKEYMDYTHTTLEEYKENYKSQIIFITGKVIKTIDDILTKSPKPPIIIIQSDHGSGAMFDHVDLKNTYLKERFSIFNAYYFPDNNYKGLYSNITPVNTFRIIFNTYFDANYKLLKDKNYYSPGSDLLNFTEVTDKIE